MTNETGSAKLPLWTLLAWRETLANKAFTLSFVINLSLGLIGFLTIDAFKSSINDHLDGRSRLMLGGDVIVSAPRSLTPEEQSTLDKTLPKGSVVRHETELMSMVAVGTHTRLVQLRAVDQAFPFYGVPLLRTKGALQSDAPRDITRDRRAWLAPELMTQLQAKIGDSIKIGGVDFTITDVMEFDPTAASGGFALAPSVFIGEDFLAETALLGKGSRVFHATVMKLPSKVDDSDDVVRQLKEGLPATELRIRSHRKASEELNRALLYLNDYLGLVALVALFLAGVGGAYLFRSFLARRSRDIAILLSLGLPLPKVRLVYVAQLLILGTLATILTGALASLVLPLLPAALGNLIPEGMHPTLGVESLIGVFLLGTLGSLLVALPLLVRLGDVKPATLFQEDGLTQAFEAKLAPKQLLAWLPALLAYWLMAVAESRSLVTGSLFVGIFLVALAIFAGAGYALTRFFGRRTSATRSFVVEMASLSLARHRAATITSFIALGLGSLLINLVPQIRGLIRTELEEPPGGARPSLFLFDIQPEQQAEIERYLSGTHLKLAFASPMIRARLISINGERVADKARVNTSASATRENDEERRALNRGYNLSYRTSLADSEELVEGRAFTSAYAGTGIPEMSLESRFAERLGLGLGAHMIFEIQGVEVEGVVVNLRRVRWTSFQPNFFVQFQPGVLDDAPKTLVAAIPAVDKGTKSTIQNDIVRDFPNVSIIDVTATIERLLGIVAQMSLAIYLMAVLTLIAGLAVLFAIAHHQAQRRIPDVTLLKVLGTDFPRLRAMALLEFGILGFAASGLGAALSVGASFTLSWFVFDRLWAFDWQGPLVLGASLGLISTLLSFIAISRSLKGRPAALLGAARFS